MNVHFDIVSFAFGDEVRMIELLLHGKRVRIPQVKTDVPGLWLVQADELKTMLGDRSRVFYSMFFGVLLEELRKKNTKLPISGISFDDIDEAYQEGRLNQFAERIAQGGQENK